MSRLIATITLAAVVLGAVALAPPAGAERRLAPKPCSLLTEKQVADLLDQPVEDGRTDKGQGKIQCLWRSKEGEGSGGLEGAVLGFEIIVHTSKQARTDFDEIVRDQENEVIDGIGDEAIADGTFAVPVIARVGKQIFEVGTTNYDTTNWDGDPRQIAIDGATLAAKKLAKGQDEPERVEQPEEVVARFADDIPVPESFTSRTAFGTEYDGGGAFGGDFTTEEVIAFYEQQLPATGYEMGEVTTEDVDGVPTTIIPFTRDDRNGQIEVSPNDDPPGATLLFITYEEVS
jgi:hypothetical protein